MTTVVYIIHIIVSFALIIIVLLQAGKGADMGAAFGGASKTVFGPRGAAGPMARITVGAAVLFMCTCLYLTWATHPNTSPGQTEIPVPTGEQTPGPATQPGTGTRTVTVPVPNSGGQIPIAPPGGAPAPITIPPEGGSSRPVGPIVPAPAPEAPAQPAAPPHVP